MKRRAEQGTVLAGDDSEPQNDLEIVDSPIGPFKVQDMPSDVLSRRHFIGASVLAAAGAALGTATAFEAKNRFKIICFIKPFQNLPFDQIAGICAEVGWSGVEVPVRKDGTIEPERAEGELPKLVEALVKSKSELTILATDVEDATDPLTVKLLTVAAKLGIRKYRVKHLHYDLKQPIPPQVANFRAKFRDLAQLNKALGIQGTIQNHSGGNNLGGPVWDIWEMIKDIDPQQVSAYFDIGHATVEGGTSWALQAKLMELHLGAVSVKDFTWKKVSKPRVDWQPEWCPLGAGMIHPQFFKTLNQSNYSGPISQHFEYPLGNGKEMVQTMKRDFDQLSKWLET